MITSPCDICVDPICNGKRNCNCDTCDKKDGCYRYAGLKPTIRITTKCTQSCSHCCFDCSPKSSDMMTVETAQMIHKFMASNNIRRAETMGGEFFLNPEWEQVLHIISEGLNIIRLVSNSDWAANKQLSKKVIDFLVAHPQYYVGLSKDRWHTNKSVNEAVKLLKEAGVIHKVAAKEESTEDSIVPVGRSELSGNFFGIIACYCSNPEKRYSFLVDENGEIHKCGFGAWAYDNVSEFQDGGFNERFKEFNTKFHSIFIGSCASCQRAEQQVKWEKNKT